MRPHLLELTFDELAEAFASAKLPAYRLEQLIEWVYRKNVTDPGGMTNVPNALAEQFEILTSHVVARDESKDGTIKLLCELHDGERIECAGIPTARRHTACVSTQAGCGMGCRFCASGLDGLKRNLTSGEILEQIIHLAQAADRRITNVVLMGTGEPLANYNASIEAVRAMIDPKRFGLSARHITISTVGLPKQIDRLAEEDLAVTLAISLHAPNDELRRQIMPVAKADTIDAILASAGRYYEARKREITIEYVLLAGVNDTNVCAMQLARLLGSLRCNVNLIAYNGVAELGYDTPSFVAVKAFAGHLEKAGINVNIRRPRGADIAAACGQLSRGENNSPPSPPEPATDEPTE